MHNIKKILNKVLGNPNTKKLEQSKLDFEQYKQKLTTSEQKRNFADMVHYLIMALDPQDSDLSHNQRSKYFVHKNTSPAERKYPIAKEGVLKYLQSVNAAFEITHAEELIAICTYKSFFVSYPDPIKHLFELLSIKLDITRLEEIGDMLYSGKLGQRISNISLICYDNLFIFPIELVDHIAKTYEEGKIKLANTQVFPRLNNDIKFKVYKPSLIHTLTKNNFKKTTEYIGTKYCRITKLNNNTEFSPSEAISLLNKAAINTSLTEIQSFKISQVVDPLKLQKKGLFTAIMNFILTNSNFRVEIKLPEVGFSIEFIYEPFTLTLPIECISDNNLCKLSDHISSDRCTHKTLRLPNARSNGDKIFYIFEPGLKLCQAILQNASLEEVESFSIVLENKIEENLLFKALKPQTWHKFNIIYTKNISSDKYYAIYQVSFKD